jgi:hypothetical protein
VNCILDRIYILKCVGGPSDRKIRSDLSSKIVMDGTFLTEINVLFSAQSEFDPTHKMLRSMPCPLLSGA